MAQHKQDTASLDYATVDMADPQNCNIYVGNISGNISDAGIEQLFSQIGDIIDVNIHRKGESLVYPVCGRDVFCTVHLVLQLAVCLLSSKHCNSVLLIQRFVDKVSLAAMA